MRGTRTSTLAVVLAVVLGGCAGNGGGGGGTPTAQCKSKVPGCNPKTPATCTPVSFKNNIQPIFNRSCALGGCHVPPSPTGGQDLSVNAAYAQAVRVKSTQQPTLFRVKPADLNQSYLYLKIVGPQSAISGVLMPQGCPGAPQGSPPAQCLSADDVQAIQTWILECAPNN